MDGAKKVDGNLASVMIDDGVAKVDTHGSLNNLRLSLADVKGKMGSAPWSVRVVYTDHLSGVLICQNPGEGNRWHYHENEDECWVVFEGEIEWEVEGIGKARARKDDIVFVPRRHRHLITCVGTEPSIRFAIGMPDVKHIFD